MAERDVGAEIANTVIGDIPGILVQARDIAGGITVHLPAPDPNARIRIGTPPMPADRYQPRPALAERLDHPAGTVLLVGGGGVGKTQLAARHAAAHWPDPDLRLALWVSARSREAVLAAYAQAAAALLGVDPSDPDQAAARLLAWCAADQAGWLIVLDDLRRPDDLHHLWPPTSEHGRVLVTTRRRDPSLARADRPLIDVDVFTPAESRAYLTAKLADHPDLADGADALAADLGHLPLALAQAVAYLTNRDWTCQRYRDHLADRGRPLRRILPTPGELPDDHDHTVATTFTLSLELAEAAAPPARPLMLLACLLDPAGIPLPVFTTAAVRTWLSTSLGRPVDAEEIEETLGVLHRLSVLTRDHGSARVHALVQRATREDAAPDTIATATRTAADALLASWPDIERDPDLMATLRANTEALRRDDSALWTPEAHEVLLRAGNSLGIAGLLLSAVAYFDALATTAGAHLGPDHPDTLTIRHNLAHWRGQAGDPAAAVTAYADLLEARTRVLGPDHPHTLTTRHNHGHWRGHAGDVIGAAAELSDLLEARIRVLGPDHPDTLTTRHNLAGWRGESGDPTGAAATLLDLLQARTRVLGPDHPDTLATRETLAHWRGRSGDPTAAAAAYADLLDDRIRLLGPDHPDTLRTRASLAAWRHQS